MCQKRNSARLIGWKGEVIKVDACMKNLIVVVNKPHYRTLACCCGHGRYNMSIVVQVEDGRIIEIMSMKEIPRKKKFYKKDKDGYFYIPETQEGEK